MDRLPGSRTLPGVRAGQVKSSLRGPTSSSGKCGPA